MTSVSITTTEQTVSVQNTQNESVGELIPLSDSVLVVEVGEIFTIPSGETVTRRQVKNSGTINSRGTLNIQ